MPVVTYHHAPAKKKAEEKKLTILDAPGVEAGKAIEWKVGNLENCNTLTPAEVAAIKKKTGCKTVKTFRALEIKRMMRTRTDAQIAKALRCSERTVWGIRAALSACRGGV